jgi:hypothetical protein
MGVLKEAKRSRLRPGNCSLGPGERRRIAEQFRENKLHVGPMGWDNVYENPRFRADLTLLVDELRTH